MYRHISFGIFFSFLFHCYSGSAGYWIGNSPITSRRLNATGDARELANQTDLSEDLVESNVLNTTENDILFWTIQSANNTTEDSEIQANSSVESENANHTLEILEDDVQMEINNTNSPDLNSFQSVENDQKPGGHDDNTLNNNVLDSEMDEKIVLQRNNCNLEIALQKGQDLKMTIKFGKLENNTSGKCCITLNGYQYSKLGVLVSSIHLHQNGSHGEILKVVIADYGSDFVVKEYYSWTKYQPLLLTETNKVYIVLYYNVENVSPYEQDSHFNLEVIPYGQQENIFAQDRNHPGFSSLNNQEMSTFPKYEPFFPPNYY